MGCCGCSLAASALTAVVLGLVESIVGMSWNILVIVIIEMKKASGNGTDASVLTTEDFFTGSATTTTTLEYDVEVKSTVMPFDVINGTDWDIFKMTLTSEEAMNKAHIFELTVTALALNSFWLITTLALAVGNAEKCRGMLRPWIFTTIIITILDIAATIYFIFRAVKDTMHETDDEIDIARLFITNISVILATLFSRGGPLVWITNIALCIFVAQRIKEIEISKKKRLPFDSDLRIGPYSLHAPYEAYEADSYRCEKTARPSTPPPDYEAYHNRFSGGGHGKSNRRRSLPSECDNSTLPVSLRSGNSVQRPVSACYIYDDDRLELQHRMSGSHQAYGYDNKAMQMEHTEGWMGIPRPTLKISR